MVLNPSYAEIELSKNIPYLSTYGYLSNFNTMLLFNNESALFNDEKIKIALNLAVDKNRLIKNVCGGLAISSIGIFPPRSEYSGEDASLNYKPKEAKRILERLGWKDFDGDGILEKDEKQFEFEAYNVRQEKDLQDTLLYVKRDLAKIGVKMNIVNIDFETFMRDYLLTRKFSSILYPSPFIGDPDFLYDLWHSDMIEKGLNWAMYTNPEVDRLLKAGRFEKDPKIRLDIYRELSDEMQGDPPGIYLFWKKNTVILNSRFSGIDENAPSVFVDIVNWKVN
jgi:peptide/nickel transport system substrate-binding protein